MATRKTSPKKAADAHVDAAAAVPAPVLVTGASGYLGLHLVRVLRNLGHAVRTLGRSSSDRLVPFEVDQRQGSVTDLDDCRRAVEGVTAIYHCAGFVSRDPADKGLMYDVHITGTRNILRAAREAGLRDVVCVSTSGVNGVSKRDDFLGREDSPIPWDVIAKWPYYESKAWAEKEIAQFVADGLPVRIARPSLLLGPGDHNGSSTGDVVKFLCGDVKAALPGGISAVDVRDVAEILPRLMTRGQPGLGYMLTGANLGLRDFLLLLEQVSGVEAPKIALPRKLVDTKGVFEVLRHTSQWKLMGGLEKQTFEMGCHYWYVDTTRARRDLGWAPRDLVVTLRDTVEELRPGLPIGD